MKAKDIALLCTAAAGAGAAAGAAVSSRTGKAKKAPQKAVKDKQVKKPVKAKPVTVSSQNAEIDCDKPLIFCTHSDYGIAAVSSDGRRAFRIENDLSVSEVRCPRGITGAAVSESCTLFITSKGGVFVYRDTEKESVFCGLTAPEYVCSFGGKFYIFSDCLLYICAEDGNIEKTVSLGAMIDITSGDICDAENSDGSFSDAKVSVKKLLPMGNSDLTAALSSDGRSFIMNRDGDFCGFEKTYEDITDLCVFGDKAYYICRMADGYGIIKTAVQKNTCETTGKYRLCGKEKTPLKIFSSEHGIGVLFDDGSIKLLLPEIRSEAKREKARSILAAMSAALSEVRAEDIFSVGGNIGVLSEGKIRVYKAE